jgi:hypothetical protein
MAITELNILNVFESCLQNPSLISRFTSIQLYTFCKWGALIVAFLATFTSLINRFKLIIFHVFRVKSLASSSSSKHLLQDLDSDLDYSDNDEEVDSSSSSDNEFDDEEFESSSQFDEDFRVAGRSKIWRCFSWSDFAAGKSVVKLWDGFGLGLDFEDSVGSEISIWDLDRDEKIRSFFGSRFENPAMAISSPAVILSTEADANKKSVLLSGYDKRMSRQTPVLYADWRQQGRQIVDVNSDGVSKVYLTDGITGGVTVGDMRNIKTPLENLTESDDDTWLEADGVIY